jgi:hypothetical protein
MSEALDVANNLAGAAALVNGLVLWPIVRSLQKTVNELKAARTESKRKRGRV